MVFQDFVCYPERNDFGAGHPILFDMSPIIGSISPMPQGVLGTVDCMAYWPHTGASTSCFVKMKGELGYYGTTFCLHIKDSNYPKMKAFFSCWETNITWLQVGLLKSTITFDLPDTAPAEVTNPYLINYQGTMTDIQFLNEVIVDGYME